MFVYISVLAYKLKLFLLCVLYAIRLISRVFRGEKVSG
jgi:hypothetical protein